MRTYRLTARTNTHFPLPASAAGLSEDVLAAELAGVVVRELSTDEWGRVTVDVELRRPSDEEALEEVVNLLWRIGFVVVRATVSEWVNEMIERAVLGALAGPAVAAGTKNAIAGVLATVAGAFVLGASGAEARRLKAEYEAERNAQGVWTLRRLPPSPRGELGLGPTLA